MVEKNETTATPIQHTQGEALLTPAAAAALLVSRRDVLDRLTELARESREVELVELLAPEGSVGIPSKVPALIKYGEKPEIVALDNFFSAHRTAPQRRAGTAEVTTLASFCDLVNRHKDEHSAIFAKTSWPDPSLTALIDYHQTDKTARFGCHRIHYAFPLTDEFKTWMRGNGLAMAQGDFALFLEEHAAELSAPLDAERTEYELLFKERFAAPIEVINLSRNLEIYVGQKIKRAERLQTGERTVVFETQHSDAKGEPVDIPGIFMVSVRAFVDGDPVRIPARLRYRSGGGEIKWSYALYRPEYWLRCQVQDDLATAAALTGLPTFEGAPEQ
ncbi:conserved hypothetical protein [Methylocella tundrae]|uniref:DUF2303 family protein n=1 Tax=Methylocella tundrae TaxID=227605 RepID=A0A8B6M545_METTU|nr:DUF2303 family protein [Methylocella tundrae]VTZ49483.1 conserved hypothetical protein [Methylocella tundrae]